MEIYFSICVLLNRINFGASNKVFTRMSSEMLTRKINDITYCYFEDEDEAKLWLLEFK